MCTIVYVMDCKCVCTFVRMQGFIQDLVLYLATPIKNPTLLRCTCLYESVYYINFKNFGGGGDPSTGPTSV